MPGTLFVVATPIGNLEDLSFRALRILRDVSLIAAEDTRRTATLLARHQIHTRTTSFHEHNEQQKLRQLLAHLLSGQSLALVSDAGTPGVSDPGVRLVRAAVEQAVPVEVIPGPSAVIAALAISGFPASSFTFLGFPPTRPAARREWFDELAGAHHTAIFFEAPHRIVSTLRALEPRLGPRPIVLARELTKVHEEVLRGTTAQVLECLATPRGEITVVVAPATVPAGSRPPSPAPPSERDLLGRFRELTEQHGLDRRAAVRAVAREVGLPANAVYAAIERARGRRG